MNLQEKFMTYIQNQGEGNCGIYAVLHALHGKDANTLTGNLNSTRKTIVHLVEALFSLRNQLLLSKEPDSQIILNLYKEIFNENGWKNFKFIALYEIKNRLEQESISTDTEKNLLEKETFLKKINTWKELEYNTTIIPELLKCKSRN